MSSIVSAILSFTVGLLYDKARDSVADKLKDGDLTDETMRKIIVKDLTDIKTKLDCLSLKELDASNSFLKEGVRFLHLAVDQSNEDKKTDDVTRVINDTTSGSSDAALSLPQAIQGLKISSDKRFVSAQDCFRKSHERATDAFNNKSLSIKDRIMACKLRVAARILELGLEDPEATISACLLSLEELHSLPTIQEMFTVFLKGGLKSKLNKSERLENMMSVLFINYALYDFACQYSSKSRYLFAWPGIELKARPFHPVLNAHEVTRKISTGGESFQGVKQLNASLMEDADSFAVNSRGDIILLHHKITVTYSTGENKDVMFPDTTEKKVLRRIGLSVAVDSDDNVYAVRLREVRDENGDTKYDFVLYAFDENYNIKNVCVLNFLHKESWSFMNIAVDKNQNLIMLTAWINQVYVCDNTGTLKFEFRRDGRWWWSLSISNNNDIMIVSDDLSAIRTYSTGGGLKSTIKVPDGHEALRVAFHHSICKIIVLTYFWKDNFYFLLSYSETGELENSVLFCKEDPKVHSWEKDIKSHPGGPLTVRWKNTITFI